MFQSDWLLYSLSIRQQISNNATRPHFSQKNNAYSSFFELILKKKQLDYSLFSVSKFRARNLIVI